MTALSALDGARGLLKSAVSVAVLTGAGVSAESGIPTFRSNGGYWLKHRFEDLATPEAFARDPKLVWNGAAASPRTRTPVILRWRRWNGRSGRSR